MNEGQLNTVFYEFVEVSQDKHMRYAPYYLWVGVVIVKNVVN
ncbi:hypothetical protein L950_0212565 [Sphingobacterium sp. IITKGP-BTPF85]|nr:hypothetical protein L950_0212565 [Sphingobacterium sp. IITKGP-BTPF85]